MSKKILCLILISIAASGSLFAQDTLPNFTVKNVGNNRIIVSWTNPFKSIRQVSIQRSFDSLTNFKTILSVPDPTTPQNGYVDTKAPNNRMFYRVYIMLERGVYMFSPVKRPVIDSIAKVTKATLDSLKKAGISFDKLDKIAGNDSLTSVPSIGISNGNKPNVFKPSVHVYTHKDGYVRINLPDDEQKKYSIRFYEENDSFLFELKDVSPRTFKIDKTNFYHAGWFKFELYEDGKLIEKHKFYLQREF